MFVRYFCDTSDSVLGEIALEYMRSMIRVAPLRIVSMTGALAGRWLNYEQLLSTPMIGRTINAVCTDSSRWTWIQKVPVPSRNLTGNEVAEAAGASSSESAASTAVRDAFDKIKAIPEVVISDRVELYTPSMRNLLFAVFPPRTKAELGTALRYERLIVHRSEHVAEWMSRGGNPHLIETPVSGTGHDKIAKLFDIVPQGPYR